MNPPKRNMFPEWETARWPCRLHGVAALLPTLIHSPCCCVADSVMRGSKSDVNEGITNSGGATDLLPLQKLKKTIYPGFNNIKLKIAPNCLITLNNHKQDTWAKILFGSARDVCSQPHAAAIEFFYFILSQLIGSGSSVEPKRTAFDLSPASK